MRPLSIDQNIMLRILEVSDASQLTLGYRRNRSHLRDWEPERDEEYFTQDWQTENISKVIEAHKNGLAYPYGLFQGEVLIGRFNIASVVRGPFQNASLGYWIDQEFTGKGLATRAVAALCAEAADSFGLHRLEASTLLHNIGSQRVLLKNGFTQIGMAPNYLKIAGRWQDHNLYQAILHD